MGRPLFVVAQFFVPPTHPTQYIRTRICVLPLLQRIFFVSRTRIFRIMLFLLERFPESGGEISPICAERKNVWSKMSVNASAVFQTCQFVQYFSVLMFFHRRNFLKEFVLKVLKTRPMSLVYKRMRKFKRVFGTTVSAYEK